MVISGIYLVVSVFPPRNIPLFSPMEYQVKPLTCSAVVGRLKSIKKGKPRRRKSQPRIGFFFHRSNLLSWKSLPTTFCQLSW